MELKIKFLKWSAGIPAIMLNSKTADEIGVHINEKVSVKTKSRNPKEVSTIVDLVEKLINPEEIAVSFELKKYLGLKQGQKVEVALSPSPKSLELIKKKLNGKILSEKDIYLIIKDVVNNSLSKPEIALFVSAVYERGMNMGEIISLIKAIAHFGEKLKLKGKFLTDKHSIGGIPGNRTTPIVVSICAAGGLIMPKSSSRAITSAAGTADVIETIAKVEFSMKELKKIVEKTNACLVWGGALGMVPADAKIIQVEKMLKIDPEPQLLASIMSKKLAAGSKNILIDIPYGETAKVNKPTALRLKRKFEFLGKHFKKNLKVILTKGDQPIGNGVGPALEIRDILNILDQTKKGPHDLEKKSLMLSGILFEMSGKAKKGKGYELAEKILYSGEAFKKFKQIIKAQGGSLNKLRDSKFKKNILAKKAGEVKRIDNKKINSLARAAGCPEDKFAGVFLHKKVGNKFKKGEKILTIHAESRTRLKQAVEQYHKLKPFKIQ
ncbi:MAG: AMP phosphorylase [Candidatus Falkowbacteria bacterium]